MSRLKLCSVCKEQKPIEEFGPESRKRSGKKYLCRACESERQRVRYHNVLTEEQRRARIERASQIAKRRWARKRELGQCMSCSNPAIKGHQKCEEHLAQARAREAFRRKELARIGMCTRCGQRQQALGMRYCTECLVKVPRNRRWKVAPIPRREYARQRYQEIRDKCFQAYGGYRCNCCGECEPRFLTIDHVHNDGATHWRSLYGHTQHRGPIYSWLRRHDYPEGFQVLCFNCNCGRALNHGICPHVQRIKTKEKSECNP